VTNPTMAKAMCACLLARDVQVWSTEAKLPVEVDTGLDLYALGLNGLAHLYPGVKLGMCNSPVK
jgi:hypothetical protein